MGKGIIKDGLVLHFDPSDPLSYPGSGLSINNIVNGLNNGNLNGDISYSPDGLGSLEYNSTSQYVAFGSESLINTNSPFTISIFFRLNYRTSAEGSVNLFHRISTLTAPGTSTLGIAYVTSYSTGYAGIYMTANNGWARVSSGVFLPQNEWSNLVVTYNGNGSTNEANFKMYLNGNPISFSSSGTTTPAATTYGNFLGVRQPGDVQQYRGKFGSYAIYNRVLSLAEVQTNLNRLRVRYGL